MTSTYQQIERAIGFLLANPQGRDLASLANHLDLSSSHLQRLFSEWAGVSPKKFCQFLTLEHAKLLLRDSNTTLIDAALSTGLSGTGRLHDLFITIEAMTPGEFKDGGRSLVIDYSFHMSQLGPVLVASTQKGICHLQFLDDYTADDDNNKREIDQLQSNYPQAKLTQRITELHQEAIKALNEPTFMSKPLHLHIKGTSFQIKVWQALLKIPSGQLSTYAQIAQQIGQPSACRAAGTAIGKNPIAVLIPCHRVIQATGAIGGYRWNPTRKSALIARESAVIYPDSPNSLE